MNSLPSTSATVPVQSDTDHDQRSTRACPSCQNPSSLAMTKHDRLVRFLCLPTFRVPWPKRVSWTCGSCGWRASNPPPAAPTQIALQDRLPASEMNPWYRTAESWHRPPSFVLRGHDLKGPTLRVEETDP